MNLVNELGSDIAMAFLFERKYREKLEGRGVRDLITRVRFILEPTGSDHFRDAHEPTDRPEEQAASN